MRTETEGMKFYPCDSMVFTPSSLFEGVFICLSNAFPVSSRHKEESK